MKPNFALNLSHEGIALLHLSPRGTWTEVGEVALDDPELRENLSFLRSTAVGLEGKGFGCKLVLPNSQILYLEIDAPGPGHADRLEQIVAALDGKTPYALADVTFDWIEAGAKVHVAVVANETLEEAEDFAVEHRFNPISFTAKMDDGPTPWEPFFGRTDYSFTFIENDVDVRDTPKNVATPDASLFYGDGDDGQTSNDLSDPSIDNEQSTEVAETSFFVAGQEETPNSNIFVEENKPEAPETDLPAAPLAEVTEEPTPAAAFSSNRVTPSDDYTDESERPLSRVASRIIVTTDPTDTTTETELRTEDLADAPTDNSALEKSRRAVIIANFLAVLVNLMNRGKKGVLALFQWLVTNVKSVLAKISAWKAARTSAAAIASVDVAPKTDGSRKKRTVLVSGIVAFVAVGLIGLIYTVFLMQGGGDGADTGNRSADDLALLTTAAERGERADNRARARPSDFAAIVASTSLDGSPQTPLLPTRPERRSVFEGQVDPDANLPDTAAPATNLTEAELADIRAAGLAAPTQEDAAQIDQLSQEELDAAYASSGILQGLTRLARQPANPERDDIFVAAIDRALKANDAIILPDFNAGVQDDPPQKRLSPLAPGTVFALDARGFVKPTTEGALNPDGILVFLGKPTLTPPTKPQTEVLVPPNPLLALRPKSRPSTLKTGADAVFVQGRMTIAQLQTRRAKPRPQSEQTTLGQDSGTTATELAVLTSFQPAKRPSDFSKTVEKTRTQIASTAPTSGKTTAPAVSTGPVLPTRANVAETATIKNAINLAKLNLIGVYGSTSKREALLRLPTGRFVRVKIGDRIDGGRVAAIGTNTLSYVKSGRNRILKIPQ
ncbi:MAG: hypothetical protein ACI9ZD_000619 [Paracoccaceae bacterium]|jgi:hypothetical protein